MAKINPPKPFDLRSITTRLTKEQMWEIKDSYENNGYLGKKYGINKNAVRDIKAGLYDARIVRMK